MEQTATAREDALILALWREAYDYGLIVDPEERGMSDEEIVEGFRSNHRPDLIAGAANGDVAALIALRQDVGLPVFS